MFFLFSRVTYHTGRDQSVHPSNFFRHCETFFPKIFSPKWSPISVCFRHCEIFFRKQKIFPIQFFDVLRQNGYLKTPKCAPLSIFWHCETFFRNFVFFSSKGAPSTATKMLTSSEVSAFSAPGARASVPRRATRSTFLVLRFSTTVN